MMRVTSIRLRSIGTNPSGETCPWNPVSLRDEADYRGAPKQGRASQRPCNYLLSAFSTFLRELPSFFTARFTSAAEAPVFCAV